MWTSWRGSHQYSPRVHKLKTADTRNQIPRFTKLDRTVKLNVSEISSLRGIAALMSHTERSRENLLLRSVSLDKYLNLCSTGLYVDRDSSVGVATSYGLDGSNPGGGEIFRTRPDRPWDPPSLLYNGYRVFLPG